MHRGKLELSQILQLLPIAFLPFLFCKHQAHFHPHFSYNVTDERQFMKRILHCTKCTKTRVRKITMLWVSINLCHLCIQVYSASYLYDNVLWVLQSFFRVHSVTSNSLLRNSKYVQCRNESKLVAHMKCFKQSTRSHERCQFLVGGFSHTFFWN